MATKSAVKTTFTLLHRNEKTSFCATSRVSWRLINCHSSGKHFKEFPSIFLPLFLSFFSKSICVDSLTHKLINRKLTDMPAQIFFTHIVGIDDQLNDILRVLVQDFYCSSRYECSKILLKDMK